METKHTPGPWHVGAGSRGVRDVMASDRAIARLYADDAPSRGCDVPARVDADARLIAAAPDLAAALARLVELADDPEAQDDDATAHPEAMRLALDAARAALAKAGVTS